MKLLLQHTQNKLYFRCGGVWTSDANSAYDFRQSHHLLEMVQMQNLRDVQAVVKFDGQSIVETIPLEVLNQAPSQAQTSGHQPSPVRG